MMHKALFWNSLEDLGVHCHLCRHHCRIAPGRRGLCGVRENRAGKLTALTYGRAIARSVDPIEKKPLYHFLPGTPTASVATRGCNFRCRHCQNAGIADISAPRTTAASGGASLAIAAWQPETDPYTAPDQLVDWALNQGCRSLAYTYTEPTVFFEYALDTARLASAQGLRNLFVTNGYMTDAPLREIAPFLDAANIDLKFFRDTLYRDLCGARLQPVLEAIARYHALGIWIEITTLIIPGYNDDTEQLRDIAAFIASLDPAIPWHVTGFYPCHQLTTAPPTDLATLNLARRIGFEAGLTYVYSGNRHDPEGSTTRCPGCGAALVTRTGMQTQTITLEQNGMCPQCGRLTEGVWIQNQAIKIHRIYRTGH